MSNTNFFDEDYKAVTGIMTEYDAGVTTEYTSVIKADRSFLGYLFLSLVTLGLYNLYYFTVSGRDLNLIATGDGRKTANFMLVFFGCVILFAGLTGLPLFYYVMHGDPASFYADGQKLRFLDYLLLFVTSTVAFAPMWIWLYHFVLRIDGELTKRKTGLRLPIDLFIWLGVIVPLGSNFGSAAFALSAASLKSQTYALVGSSVCGVLSVVSALICMGYIISSMNTLARCIIYRNVDFM